MSESNKELINSVTKLFAQRYETLDSLVQELNTRMGKPMPNEATISTFMIIANELGNFYRFVELELKLIAELQSEIEVVAKEAHGTKDKEETKVLLDKLNERFGKIIRDTTANWVNRDRKAEDLWD
jgi:hypothetical protein